LNIQRPEDGVLISGLYFESARWDYEKHCITEQRPKQLYSIVPIIHLLPTRGANYVEPPKKVKDDGDNESQASGKEKMNSTGNKSSFEKKAKATGMTFDEAKPKVEEELRFECPIY
jgi:hypothetical protein